MSRCRASAAGLQEILLGTTDKFLAAHRFYERQGFTAVALADLPASFPRMAVDTRFYRRALTAPPDTAVDVAVVDAAAAAFPGQDPAPLLGLLATYGMAAHECEVRRVQLALVKLAAGSPAALARHLDVAKTDYRDVLAAAEAPAPTAEQAASDREAAKALLAQWGSPPPG